MKLLIIEDEVALQKALVKGFQKLGYAVEAAGDGEQALELYYGNQYNLIILDLNLPILDGLNVLNEIRGENKEVPVLILSARSEVSDKITGLDKGANDYLEKPFHFEELEARVRALLRRDFKIADTVISCDNVKIDTALKKVFWHSKVVDISVGDMIQISGMVLSEDEGRVNPDAYDLVVTGIYYDTTDPNGNSIMPSALMNRRNEILTVFETLQANSAGLSVSVTYYLKNPDLLADFNDELRLKGLKDIYNVTIDEAAYKSVVGSVEGMKKVSLTFLLVVLILGAVILTLLSSIAIRERKYEIGVLRAMGMKRGKVALGLWSEMFFITLFCLIIGIGVGTLVAQPVSDTLLAGQITSTREAQQNTQGGNFITVIGGSSSESDNEPIDEVKVTLGTDTIFEIIAISLLLASVAGLTVVIRITKYEPIKILMERN